MCAYYMSIGMTYEEYWHGNPWLTKYYYEAHLKRVEARNQELWLQGFYFSQALNSALANAFSKKGAKPQHYLKEPIRITPKTEREKEREEKERIAKIKRNLDKMEEWWRSNDRPDGY